MTALKRIGHLRPSLPSSAGHPTSRLSHRANPCVASPQRDPYVCKYVMYIGPGLGQDEKLPDTNGRPGESLECRKRLEQRKKGKRDPQCRRTLRPSTRTPQARSVKRCDDGPDPWLRRLEPGQPSPHSETATTDRVHARPSGPMDGYEGRAEPLTDRRLYIIMYTV